MNIHIDADGGLVSNPSDREIQGTSDFATRAAALVSDVSTLSWNEPRIAKRDIGHLSNMKLNDPSTSELSIPAYIGKSTGRALDFGFRVCLSVQKRYTNRRVGIVLGGPLQIDLTSCRDGNKGICSSLGQGNLKSKSLFHANPLVLVLVLVLIKDDFFIKRMLATWHPYTRASFLCQCLQSDTGKRMLPSPSCFS